MRNSKPYLHKYLFNENILLVPFTDTLIELDLSEALKYGDKIDLIGYSDVNNQIFGIISDFPGGHSCNGDVLIFDLNDNTTRLLDIGKTIYECYQPQQIIISSNEDYLYVYVDDWVNLHKCIIFKLGNFGPKKHSEIVLDYTEAPIGFSDWGNFLITVSSLYYHGYSVETSSEVFKIPKSEFKGTLTGYDEYNEIFKCQSDEFDRYYKLSPPDIHQIPVNFNYTQVLFSSDERYLMIYSNHSSAQLIWDIKQKNIFSECNDCITYISSREDNNIFITCQGETCHKYRFGNDGIIELYRFMLENVQSIEGEIDSSIVYLNQNSDLCIYNVSNMRVSIISDMFIDEYRTIMTKSESPIKVFNVDSTGITYLNNNHELIRLNSNLKTIGLVKTPIDWTFNYCTNKSRRKSYSYYSIYPCDTVISSDVQGIIAYDISNSVFNINLHRNSIDRIFSSSNIEATRDINPTYSYREDTLEIKGGYFLYDDQLFNDKGEVMFSGDKVRGFGNDKKLFLVETNGAKKLKLFHIEGGVNIEFETQKGWAEFITDVTFSPNNNYFFIEMAKRDYKPSLLYPISFGSIINEE